MTKRTILFSWMILFSATLFAQGWVKTELSTNGPLILKRNELQKKSLLRSGGSITDTLVLDINGFIDDFSYEGPYPDTAKWLDNKVYINRDLPIAPPTLGVATFDGLNADGYPYDFLAGQFSTGKADTLTSKPIDLNFPGDTSTFFSFYYQAQGRGNYPDAADSLILEFKDVLSGGWDHVWATKGLTHDITDSSWTRVMIHITENKYLQKGFQFRFTNWATLSGNGDHWHLDLTYLNRNRVATDTLMQDAAYVYNTPSLLNTYTSMPWEQYNPSYMKTQYSATVRNNNNVSSFGTSGYAIYDENNVQVNTTYSGGAINYVPYETSGYITDAGCASPPLNYSIPALTAKTDYTIKSYIFTSPDKIIENDTVLHKQIFDNYYAYDDGTAEISFGLLGFLHAQMAEKFATDVSDSLQAVDIYFNPQWTDASQFTFKLKVWAAAGSTPGTVLYLEPGLDTPRYDLGRNGFARYYLHSPLYLSGGTTFFIGFDQNTSQSINIGVDRNTNSQNKIYYNTSGGWNNSPDYGSLMMRPIMGTAAAAVGIETYAKETDNSVSVYPNPARDKLYFRFNGGLPSQKTSYTVMDLFGRTILEKTEATAEYLDISGLSNGIYFVRAVRGSHISTTKFMVAH